MRKFVERTLSGLRRRTLLLGNSVDESPEGGSPLGPLQLALVSIISIVSIVRRGRGLLRLVKLRGEARVRGESSVGRSSGGRGGEGGVGPVRARASRHVVRAFSRTRNQVEGFFSVSGVAAGLRDRARLVDITYVRVHQTRQGQTGAGAGRGHAGPSAPAQGVRAPEGVV